jgi:signal transduction histidine kinase
MQACCRGDEILISTQRQGAELIVRVTDTGPGMDKITQEQAFVPYFSTKKNGTGLGLAIARRIVEAHGGTIHMSSEFGKGTQFTLLFPTRRLLQGGDG